LKNFVKRWLGEPAAQPTPALPEMEAGRRLYCIGDIHGRLDLLEELLGMILQDCAGFDGRKIAV